MVRWRMLVSLGVVLGAFMALVLPATASSSHESVLTKIDPELLRELYQEPPTTFFRFIVQVRGEADLEPLPLSRSSLERRVATISQLKAFTTSAQAKLLTALETLEADGVVTNYRPFWIINGIAIEGNRFAALALAARSDVVQLRPDRWRQWITVDETPAVSAVEPIQSWGVSHIRADQVWSSFGIDGTGVVVAVMDTGVDWIHPVLQPAYRGWHNGVGIHTGNWYDAIGAGALYPVDSMGHGTHVTGLLAGQDGLGVAPGARWIAVRAFDSGGYGLDSWIHAGFQWLMAPAGDPALAPDIVSNSWSSAYSANEEFRPDVEALLAAGILPLFAAGNNGPEAGTIGAPASYPESLAVGAVDPDDEVASFSGRGPSPFGGIKPEVVAPGTNLLSSLPGGAYGENSGTSMATPIVAGLAALIYQGDPTFTAGQIQHVITSTAVAIESPTPNMDSGWGRVDAVLALEAVLHPGHLSGQVREPGAEPVGGAKVTATERDGPRQAVTTTDQEGQWSLAVASGIYNLTAEAFGYEPARFEGILVLSDTVTYQDLVLQPLPTGQLSGSVAAAGSGEPLPAIIRVQSTPVTSTASTSGVYTLTLPSGVYTITAEHWAYRVDQAVVTVTAGYTTEQDLILEAAPTMLLVDTGPTYYGSEIATWQAALKDGGYLYHDWGIKLLPQDALTLDDLVPYDVVLWSSPKDSPGLVGAGTVISNYLGLGGNLFLSGQDVAFWESGASGLFAAPYFWETLQARFLADNAGVETLNGSAGHVLEGLSLTLNGPDSAGNQSSPDVVVPRDSDWARPLLDYAPGEYGGLATGLCLPYRAFFMSVGLEGIEGREMRAEIVDRALGWFTSPRLDSGTEIGVEDAPLIGAPGSTLTHTVRLRNIGEVGGADRYTITLDQAGWPTVILSPTVELSSCATAQIPVRVQVPEGLGRSQVDQAVVRVQSQLSPSLILTATLTSKTPAPILLVDDDRWYDQAPAYQEALERAELDHDMWNTSVQHGDQLGGPSIETLQLYPLVIWYTGYDWFRPLTQQEVDTLTTYLEAGGRFFLSSQDVLYYHGGSVFSQDYLGVLAHQEDVTPTIAYGGRQRLGIEGEYELAFPFRNFSDGLIPAGNARVEFYSEKGWAMGLTNQGAGDWKTAFFSFPLEALPAAEGGMVMDRVAGWLGWLGGSEFQASARVVPSGAVVTFTTTLRNDGPEPATTSWRNPVPPAFDLLPETVEGGLFDGQQVTWQGTLPPAGEHLVRYSGTVSGIVTNTAVISYAEHNLAQHRQVRVWVDAPDLSDSTVTTVPPMTEGLVGRPITYALYLHNSGPETATGTHAEWALPGNASILTGTVNASSGSADTVGSSVTWDGAVASGQTVTVTLSLWPETEVTGGWLSTAALLEDGSTAPIVRGHWLEVRPLRVYLPLLLRGP